MSHGHRRGNISYDRCPTARGSAMHLPRMTIRRLMILVAVVAVMLAIPLEVLRLRRLRAYYLGVLAENQRWEEIYREQERGWKGRLVLLQGGTDIGDTEPAVSIAKV